MLSFKTFMDRLTPKKKYVCVKYSQSTQDKLRMWCYLNGFDLTHKFDGSVQNPTDFDFHTTIFFTTTEHSILNYEKPINNFSVIPIGMEYLGENHDIPVMKVYSSALLSLRTQFEIDYGMQDAWPDYKPHISVSYNRHALPDISKVKLPDFSLIADTLKVEDAAEF